MSVPIHVKTSKQDDTTRTPTPKPGYLKLIIVRTRSQNGFLYDLLLYDKVVFLDFRLQYKHNDRMPFSPELELKNRYATVYLASTGSKTKNA